MRRYIYARLSLFHSFPQVVYVCNKRALGPFCGCGKCERVATTRRSTTRYQPQGNYAIAYKVIFPL